MSARHFPFASLMAVALVGCIASAASGQVFYEPVRYEHGSGDAKFYYGGHHAQVFEHVAADVNRTAYSSAVTQVPVVARNRVYSDAVPFQNLADESLTTYGSYTPSDARNEAYRNVPRYFRKHDLLMSRDVQLTEDATLVVPAYARPRIEIRIVRPFGNGAQVDVPKGSILITPKKAADPKRDASRASAE